MVGRLTANYKRFRVPKLNSFSVSLLELWLDNKCKCWHLECHNCFVLTWESLVFCQHPLNWLINRLIAIGVKSQTLHNFWQSQFPYHQLSHKANFPNLFLHLSCKANRKILCSINLLKQYYASRYFPEASILLTEVSILLICLLHMSLIQSKSLLHVLKIFIVRKDKTHPDSSRW